MSRSIDSIGKARRACSSLDLGNKQRGHQIHRGPSPWSLARGRVSMGLMQQRPISEALLSCPLQMLHAHHHGALIGSCSISELEPPPPFPNSGQPKVFPYKIPTLRRQRQEDHKSKGYPWLHRGFRIKLPWRLCFKKWRWADTW